MTEASEWQGGVGDVWAQEWRRTDRAFAGIGGALDAAILAALPPAAGTPLRVLDVGTGAGATTLALATARSDVVITAVDLSAELAAIAAARVADRPELRDRVAIHVGDAVTEAAAAAPLDLVMSRHGVMFFPDPVAAFTALRAAARPGAPLVFSCFRDRSENPWGGGAAEVVSQAPLTMSGTAAGPFAFADPAHVAAILSDAGWRDAAPSPVDTRFRVGAGSDPVADAVAFFTRIGSAAGLLRALPARDRPAALARLAAFAAGHRRDDAIDFPAAIWIWSARA